MYIKIKNGSQSILKKKVLLSVIILEILYTMVQNCNLSVLTLVLLFHVVERRSGPTILYKVFRARGK
jgi:hypothetical protein